MKGAVAFRILSGFGASGSAASWKTGDTTEGGQDKRAHIALRSVGCFCRDFWGAPHLAPSGLNVPRRPKPLDLIGLPHIRGPHYGR